MPSGWTSVALGELFEFKYGKGLPQDRRNDKGSVPVYGSNGLVGIHDSAVTQGPTIIIGRKGSAGEINLSSVACWPIDTTYFIDEFPLELPPLYWAFYLKSLRLGWQEKSTAIPGLSRGDVYAIAVPIPPLAEQRRIVAKLEKLLSKVDACRARLEKIPVILKRFRQAVLAAACSGRLTADWREKSSSNESITAVVESIYRMREAEAITKSQKDYLSKLIEVAEKNDSNELPEGWQFVNLNKLCSTFDYGTSAKSQPSGKVPVLRMGNIQEGRIDWADLVYSSDDKEIQKFALEPGTVLFNRTNSPELVGKTAIYRGERPAIFAGYLIRINPFPELNPEYLNLCLNTNYAKEFCLTVKTDGVSQSNINAQKLGTFEIPFCPISEQAEIVRRVEELFVLADRIEARYKKAKDHIEKLTQSILAKAFRGELVPQDPNDEPASELLNRIKADHVTKRDSRRGKTERR